MMQNRTILFFNKFLAIAFVCVVGLSGCSFFLAKTPKAKAHEAIVVTKKQAVQIAQDFLSKEGFENEFVARNPYKISKQFTMEKDPKWIWQVYFPSREQRFWNPFKKSPLVVQVDAMAGTVVHWGRR